MDKKTLTESDIRTKFITPAIVGASGEKWDVMSQIREEAYFTAGRVIVRGKTVKRGKAKKADYILYDRPNIPLAVVEAKDNKHSVGDGMQQALDYAEILDIPFAYSSNGDAFLEHDRTGTSGTVTREISLDQFPSPQELWSRYQKAKGYTPAQEAIVTQDYYDDGTGREPRHYQATAINRTVDAIARGQNRILLVMATGTGKTFTAFQIIWRLWKSGAKKRVLFLVDRNILANQTMIGDFKPFKGRMVKLTSRNSSIEKSDGTTVNLPTGVSQDRKVDKSYEVYLCLYQAVTGTDEKKNIYKQFSRDFFDLIVIDECHRGSAADDASWRKVLTYFDSATQIGLTATPKEKTEIDKEGKIVIEELAAKGVFLDELAEQVGADYDAFDLICHVAYDQPPLTRKERADKVKKRDAFAKYGEQAQEVMAALLEKYAAGGIANVESMEILRVDPLSGFGTPFEIVSIFGGKKNYQNAIKTLEDELYKPAA